MGTNSFLLLSDNHNWKVGAVVCYRFENEMYYLVFRSLSCPERGTQIPRGTVESGEEFSAALQRELSEEMQIPVEIIQPFLVNHYDYATGTDTQIYYVCTLKDPVHPDHIWQVTDKDASAQVLEWRSVPLSMDPSFLSRKHDEVIRHFKMWFSTHKDLF